MALAARVPLSAQCEERSGEAGYRDAEVSHRHFCQRMLLARTLCGGER